MPTQRALLIGINYVGTAAQLRGCVNDAHNVKDYLVKRLGYKEQEIRLLADEQDYERPTRANILAGIAWLIDGAARGDKLFFHYSGHGTWVRDQSGDERDGRDECLVPSDYQSAGLIVDDEFRRLLVNPLPRQVRLTVILDMCHSGTGLDLRWNYTWFRGWKIVRQNGKRKAVRAWKQRLRPTERAQRWTRADVVMLSGCRDNQFSADAWEDQEFIGAMSWAFLQIVEKQRRGRLTYARLMAEMRQLLRERGYSQVPQLSCGRWVGLNRPFVA